MLKTQIIENKNDESRYDLEFVQPGPEKPVNSPIV